MTTTSRHHPAADDDDDADGVRDLVPSWLRSANLGYAISNFEMAGILTPRSFAELELRYFEPLGVTDGDDRKRLFYLVQRVRGELRREEEEEREGAARERKEEMRSSGGVKARECDDDDDARAVEKIRSPSNRDFDCRGDVGGAMEVISPVTLSSPIAGSSILDGDHDRLLSRRHHHHHHVGDDDGGIVISAKIGTSPFEASHRLRHSHLDHGGIRGAGTDAGMAGAGVASASPAKMTAREQLERELESRAERRREQKRLMERHREHVDDDNNNVDASRSRDGGSRRRQSFLPPASNHVPADIEGGTTGGIRPSSRPSSSVATSRHRPPASAATASALAASSKESNGVYEDRRFDRDAGDELDNFPSSRPPRDGNDHHRRTVKQTNVAAREGGSAREEGRGRKLVDDAVSVASDTSDLSASVLSNNRSSMGVASRSSSGGGSSRRRSSIPCASAASHLSSSSLSGRISSNIVARGGLLGQGSVDGVVGSGTIGGVGVTTGSGRVDENKNNVNFDEKMTRTISAKKIGSSLVRDEKKRLSIIPSSAIAPLSPLAAFSSTRLDRSMLPSRLAATAAATAASSVGPSNPLRRGSRSSVGSASGSGSVGGCGGKSVPSSSSRPDTTATSESKKDPYANLKANGVGGVGIGVPLITATSVGSSNRLSRPSSRSSMDGSQRFDVYNRLDVSSSPGGNKSLVSASAASAKRQRQRLEPPAPPMSSHGSSVGEGGGSVRSQHQQQQMSPPSSRRGERAMTPTRSVSSARSKRAVSPINGGPSARARSPARSSGFGDSNKFTSSIENSENNTGGAVFVHGALEDTSWTAQIGRLRDSFDHEHAKYLSSTGRLLRQQQTEEDDLDYEMRIRVIVRKRPMSSRESSGGSDVDALQPLEYDDYGRILVHQPKTKLDLTKEVETTSFAFDNVFDEKSNNIIIYEKAVQRLIPGVFRGKWASVFAYGQTGSGKTFTMMGFNATGKKAGNQAENSVNRANLGLYCLAAQDVFRIAEDPAYANIQIGVSLFEIYGGKLLDLLNARNPVRCLEDSHGKVCFPGLSEHPVSSAEELMDIIDAGALNRSTGTTSANADSSRSHAVLQLSLRKDVGRVKNKEHGRLTFIDLAGSERGADTSMACRTTRMEGAEINTSLLALKEVIRALATGGSLKRIPFRGSKLTQVLKESFVGKNSRTVMVACVAPNMKNCDHTLNTLRYADRVKERDPHTGKLSASVAASSKMERDQVDDMVRIKLPPPRPLTAPAASFRIVKEEEWSDDDPVPPPPSKEELLAQSFDESNLVDDDEYSDTDGAKTGYSEVDVTIDSLDEALKSNDTLSSVPLHESTLPRQSSLRENPSAQSLIASHKSIMSKLLQMLQHEMTLVNDTDANRDNIDDYLKELEQLSGYQLSLLSTLRESLVSYHSANGKHGTKSIAKDTSDNDDSFDLRL